MNHVTIAFTPGIVKKFVKIDYVITQSARCMIAMSQKGERMTDILLGFILFFIILTDVLIYQIAMNQVGMNKWNIDMFDRIRRGQFDFFNVMERKIDRLDANQQRLNAMVKDIKGEKNDGERKNNC